MQFNRFSSNSKPVVSVLMVTYNHELFIAKAIEGVLMQKTNFNFELVIGEDCSKDRTRTICIEYQKKHPELIKLILQDKNQGAHANFLQTLSKCKGKYIAICEGDDYWTDAYKLQKQVDILDENEGFGLVYTNVDKLIEKTKHIEKDIFNRTNESIKNSFEDFLINAWFLAPCTWVFRVSVLKLIDPHIRINYIVGDLPLLLGISKYSRIAYLDDTTAIYRVLEGSASHFNTLKRFWEFSQGIFKIQMDFVNYYNVSNDIILRIKNKFYAEAFTSICLFGDNHLREEAYYHLKTEGLNSNKQKFIFFLTTFLLIKKLWLRIISKY